MPFHDIVVVSLIASAFAAFGVTLGATIWYANKENAGP